MNNLNVPGEYEAVDGGYKPRQKYDVDEYIESEYRHVTALLADTDVDSFDNPLKPAIPSGNSTTWVLTWYYTDPYELMDEYDDPLEYGIHTHGVDVALDYGDDRFDNDIDTKNYYPEDEENEHDSASVSLSAGIGPFSASAPIDLTALAGETSISVDDKTYQYAEWSIPTYYTPQGQDEAAGVVFDMKGGVDYTTASFSAEWSSGFNVVEKDTSCDHCDPYTTIYTRTEGESFDLDVEIVPDNNDS